MRPFRLAFVLLLATPSLPADTFTVTNANDDVVGRAEGEGGRS